MEELPSFRTEARLYAQGLAMLYHMTLDELIEYDFDEQQLSR